MNSEAKKLPEQNPEGYSPKKPEILDLAQKAKILMQKTMLADSTENGHFEYLKTGRMRFIGAKDGEDKLRELMPVLENLLKDHASVIPFFCHLCHHGHKEIGEEEERNLDGYFFMEGTPVPVGADYFDILSEDIGFGVYITRDAMKYEDADWCRRYDQTRDRILGDGNLVPYPIGYWDSVAKIEEASENGEFAYGIVLPALVGEPYDAFLEKVGMK